MRADQWKGGFEAARRIAWEILNDYAEPEEQAPKIAEALVEAFDDGVSLRIMRIEDPEDQARDIHQAPS